MAHDFRLPSASERQPRSDEGEHHSLDRFCRRLHRRTSGFPWAVSGSVVLASSAQRQCRLAEGSSTGLDSTPPLPCVFLEWRSGQHAGKDVVRAALPQNLGRAAPSNTTCLESTEKLSLRRMMGTCMSYTCPKAARSAMLRWMSCLQAARLSACGCYSCNSST